MSITIKELDELISSIAEIKPFIEKIVAENRDLRIRLAATTLVEKEEINILEEVARMKILNDSVVYSILTDQITVEDIISAAKKDGNLEVVKFWSDKKSPKYFRN